VDPLALQRSLSVLEQRFHELHEGAEARLLALVDERDDLVKQKEEALKHLMELQSQLAGVVQENESNHRLLAQAQKALEKKESEAKCSSAEVELVMMQLQQLQEELERCLLISRCQSKLLSESSGLSDRLVKLLFKTF